MKIKSILLFSLLLNLVFGGAGVVFIARRGGFSFLSQQLKGSAPDQGSEAYFNERRRIFSTLPAREGAIVFLGDSLTERCPWNELLQRNDIITRGIGGEDIKGVLRNVDEVTRHKPKRVFVMAGTNDLIGSKSTQDIMADYQQLITTLKHQAPQSVLVIQSILPMNKMAFAQSSDEVAQKETRSVNRQATEINKQLQDMADGQKIIYCDIAKSLTQGDQLDPKVTSDGQHLNAQGYLRWKDKVMPLLSANPKLEGKTKSQMIKRPHVGRA